LEFALRGFKGFCECLGVCPEGEVDEKEQLGFQREEQIHQKLIVVEVVLIFAPVSEELGTNVSAGTLALSNANIASATITNLLSTNQTTATLNASTGITSAALLVTGLISSANLFATTSTIPNIIHTNVSTATLQASTLDNLLKLNTRHINDVAVAIGINENISIKGDSSIKCAVIKDFASEFLFFKCLVMFL
jgi:hypothetical protein